MMKFEELLTKLVNKYGDKLGDSVYYQIYLGEMDKPFVKVRNNSYYENFIFLKPKQMFKAKVNRMTKELRGSSLLLKIKLDTPKKVVKKLRKMNLPFE